jgi:hypothetical protein
LIYDDFIVLRLIVGLDRIIRGDGVVLDKLGGTSKKYFQKMNFYESVIKFKDVRKGCEQL